VVANKQDLPGALTPEEIRNNSIYQRTYYRSRSAKDRWVFEAFEVLIDRITGETDCPIL